ncbi:MAG: gluconokinase [Arachnia sp.]
MSLTHLVVMGVSGCGKSTVARRLGQELGWVFAEGDGFHPAANVAKMSAGVPLTDEDRWPWLDAIVAWTSRQHACGHATVVACSALRRAYRDRLRATPGHTPVCHLTGSEAVVAQRLAVRVGHFMPPSLLRSQLASLEPLEPDEAGFTLDIAAPIAALVGQARTAIEAAARRHPAPAD